MILARISEKCDSMTKGRGGSKQPKSVTKFLKSPKDKTAIKILSVSKLHGAVPFLKYFPANHYEAVDQKIVQEN